jgi:hypothetical protein
MTDVMAALSAPLAPGDVLRVADTLATFKVVEQHVQKHTIAELQFYPDHEGRTETPAYKKVHDRLTKTLDLPCMVCGVRASILKDKAAAKDPAKNPYQARQMETHHHIVEWALANAVDVDRFNNTLRPTLAHQHPNDPTWSYETPFDQAKVAAWVDHSEHNLWVLCDVHHRAKYLGIHEITYPIWAPMALLRADFEAWALQQIRGQKVARVQPQVAAPGR